MICSFVSRCASVRGVLLACAALTLSACATPGRTTMEDPWQPMNRGIYKFNDVLDRSVVKPIAKGYQAITPNWLRARFGQFFSNLGYPATMINQLLQGKPVLFAQDTGRFITNSTLGLAGFFDVADHMGMPEHDEDFGQTLAVWGTPSGPYLTLPFYGPSTVRDAPGRVVGWFMSVPRYLNVSPAVDYGLKGAEVIDTRASLLSSEATLESAFDRYGVIRDSWLQRREYLIFDGRPPEETLELEDELPGDDNADGNSSNTEMPATNTPP